MKIAIHQGTGLWFNGWVKYCKSKCLDYIIVDGHNSDIISNLKYNNITHFLWHVDHASPIDTLMAKNVLYSAEKMGIKVFPNFSSIWYFDDKISEKYILEALDAPLVKTWIFYDKHEALSWLKNSKYPLVAKLRKGAGSRNVILLKSFRRAKRYTKRMFSKGINPFPGILSDYKTRIKNAHSFSGLIKKLIKLPSMISRINKSRLLFPVEKGYVYFQEFLAENDRDYRIEMVGDICWGFVRMVRNSDFRASGSGDLSFNPSEITSEMLSIAFNIKKKLVAQTIAFDFVLDNLNSPRIVEISYAFNYLEGCFKFYFNSEHTLFQAPVNVPELIIHDFLHNI